MGALHNSLEWQELDAPKCHPDTRIAVISRLIQWITGEIDFDALILWLYGAAGAGKSAIAHSITDICMERRLNPSTPSVLRILHIQWIIDPTETGTE